MSISKRRLSIVANVFLVALVFNASAAGAVEAAPATDIACVVLREAVYAKAIPGHPLSGQYVCTAGADSSILALRYVGPEIGEYQSNLVGYYKVSLSDGAIHEWDVGRLQVGKLIFAPKGKGGSRK